jgi:hypothetical protein
LKFVLNDIPADIGFEASYVTQLLVQPDIITINADFALRDDHPFYTPIHPGKQCCYLAGTLTITSFKNLQWTSVTTRPAREPDGSKSWDFDYFNKDGNIWILGGGWGEIKVTGDKVMLSIEWIEPPTQTSKP